MASAKRGLARWQRDSALAAQDGIIGGDPGLKTILTTGNVEVDPATGLSYMYHEGLSNRTRINQEQQYKRIAANGARFKEDADLCGLRDALRAAEGGRRGRCSPSPKSTSSAEIIAYLSVVFPRARAVQAAFAKRDWSRSRFGALSARQSVTGGHLGRRIAGRLQGGTLGTRNGLCIGDAVRHFKGPGVPTTRLLPWARAAAAGVRNGGYASCSFDVPEAYTTVTHAVCGDRLQNVCQPHPVTGEMRRLHSPKRDDNPACPLFGFLIPRDPNSSDATHDMGVTLALGEPPPWPQANRKAEGVPRGFNRPALAPYTLPGPHDLLLLVPSQVRAGRRT